MKYIFPKTEPELREKLKNFKPKDKEGLIYYIRLCILDARFELHKLEGYRFRGIDDCRRRWELHQQHWKRFLISVMNMPDEDVKKQLV